MPVVQGLPEVVVGHNHQLVDILSSWNVEGGAQSVVVATDEQVVAGRVAVMVWAAGNSGQQAA